jgi:ketosteroid isomerase-like protein
MVNGQGAPAEGPTEPDATAVFRRFHEAWTDGDLDAALALVEPDVIVRPLHGLLYSRLEFRGRDGIEQWYREMTEPWERFEAIVETVQPTPEGLKGTLKVVGYRDGEPYHARVGAVCHMRNGRIAELIARNVGDIEAEMRAGGR